VDSSASFRGQKISLLGKKKIKGLSDALARKAAIAAALAQSEGADLLVFVTDLDGGSRTRTKVQKRSELERKGQAIGEGAELGEAELRCIPGIPCRTIEAWALGDMATVELIGGDRDHMPAGKLAEELWGKVRDPSSNHPKMVFERVLGRTATRRDFSEIAERADLTRVRRNCSLSFEPFADALEECASS
jgi:hypothetical protein